MAKQHEIWNPAVTKSMIERTVKEWSQIAGEQIQVEATGVVDPIRAFGSELACLRLYRAFNGRGRCFYSKNLDTWCFSTLGQTE